MKNRIIILILIIGQLFLVGTCKKSKPEQIGIKDDAFYLALIGDGVDRNGDGIITREEALQTSHLDVSQGFITDMTGIAEFENLEELDCSSNQLITFDLSGNLKLKKLKCQGNRLKSLDITFNTLLTELNCGGTACCGNNELTTLDLSGCRALEILNCSYNNLTELDVSQCLSLKSLNFCYNSVENIDLSENQELLELNCGSNYLTNLNVTANPMLEQLICYQNLLTVLDISSNTGLEYLVISDMPSLQTVCVWGNSLPPATLKVIKYGSPNVIITNNCSN